MKSSKAFVERAVSDSLNLKKKFFDSHFSELSAFCKELKQVKRAGKKVLIFGNGGSAADAQHFAAELMHKVEHRPLFVRALALHTDTSFLTAYANDEDFQHAYAHQIEVLAEPGDLAVAISTSGNSANIVEALRVARAKKCKTIGLLGRNGGKAKELCDLKFVVPHNSTPRIQEVHGMVIHLVCQLLEENL
jgi:D-sedoheptulose 7-phosphate isomerase